MSITLLMVLALAQTGLLSPLPDADRVAIIDGSKPKLAERTEFDAGPALGDGLNGHFFPGVIHYNRGNYNAAVAELTYVVRRPTYLDGNPRKGEFLSVAHYLRGMVYLYHAEGLGRHAIAKVDFETAIRWNPANYLAYLELSRVYSDVGATKEAIPVIERLLELKPPKEVVDEAEQELKKLTKK